MPLCQATSSDLIIPRNALKSQPYLILVLLFFVVKNQQEVVGFVKSLLMTSEVAPVTLSSEPKLCFL